MNQSISSPVVIKFVLPEAKVIEKVPNFWNLKHAPQEVGILFGQLLNSHLSLLWLQFSDSAWSGGSVAAMEESNPIRTEAE